MRWLLAATVLTVVWVGVLRLREEWRLERMRRVTLRVGLQDSPPWYHVPKEAWFSGPAHEIVNEAAKRLRLRIEWVEESRGPDAALGERRVDVWPLAGRTLDRLERYFISDPWLELPYWLVFDPMTQRGIPPDGGGMTLAARDSALTQQLIRSRYPQAKVVLYPSHLGALHAVCNGETSAAFIVESLILEQSANAAAKPCLDHRVRLSSMPVAAIGFGVAARSDAPEAIAAAKALQREILAMTNDGLLTSIMLRWGQTSGEIRAYQEQLKTRRLTQVLVSVTVLLSLTLLALGRYYFRLAGARRSLQYQAQLLEQNHDAVVALDTQGTITYWNQAAERLLDRPASEAMGRPGEAVLAANVREAITRPEPRDVPVEQSGGERLSVQVAPSPLVDSEGRPMGTVVILRDVTHTRDLEERYRASQRIESLGRLAGGIAHDFNNLLTIISGWSQLLMQRCAGQPSTAAPLENILQAARQASNLTQQLLAFGRRQILQPQPMDLNHAAAQVTAMMGRLLEASVTLRLELAEEPLPVRADLSQLTQVILNLALNARDAMPEGGTLTIRTEWVERDGARWASLSITDTGIGMDEGTRARVFEPFFTTKEKGRGTGLGLATVYGIIHQSGGTVTVRSEPGEGSAFTVLLPETKDPIPVAPVPGPAEVVAPAPLRVLLAEDERGVLEYLGATLRESGFSVIAVSGLPQVGEMLKTGLPEFDVLVTDVVMPGGSGPELARMLRAGRPTLPVLYLSGYSETEWLRAELERPGVGYLPKPCEPSELVAAIGRLQAGAARGAGDSS